MRRALLVLVLAGCGGSLGEDAPPPKVTVSAGDPFECRLDADRVACHCTIPEYSADAIAEMGNRCNFLRGVADSLY